MAIATQPLGSLAQGTIGQGANPAQGALDLLAGGTFTRTIEQWLFGICGDERCDVHGIRLQLPAGFGGFAAIVVTDALTTRTWYKPGMTFLEHARKAWEEIKSEFPDAQAAVHTDETAQANATGALPGVAVECGCAAIAKAGDVLKLLITQQDQIAAEYREQIVVNAQDLLANGYAQPNTARTVEALREEGLDVEVLTGQHEGIALIRNEVPGTIIDRPALYKACKEAGLPVLWVFEYDVWAMREAAQRLTNQPELFVAGGDALMMATIRAIASPDLTVITLT